MLPVEEQLAQLRKENQWLQLELEMFRNEEKQFNRDENISFGTGDIPSIVPPVAHKSLRDTVSSPSLAGYFLVADGWHGLLSWLLRRKPSSVLDIGCGCGKLVRPLIYNPHVSRYIGIDNFAPSIDWCRQHLEPMAPERFRFLFVDVKSEAYNAGGAVLGRDFVFPVDDGSVDLAIAASLFTHLREDDARNYLMQSRRVLCADGRLAASIHTDTTGQEKYAGNEIRIDVRVDYFLEMAESCGLGLEKDLGILLGQQLLLLRSM